MLQNNGEVTPYDSPPRLSEHSKLESLNRKLPGLQALQDMMTFANGMPHPAITRVESKKMLRATVLSSLTLELLEVMMSSMTPKRKSCDAVDTLRYTVTEGFSLVKITKNISHRCARVELSGSGKVIREKPTDSPEFIVAFGLNSESLKSTVNSPQNLFFTQVALSNESPFSHAVSLLKQTKDITVPAGPSFYTESIEIHALSHNV